MPRRYSPPAAPALPRVPAGRTPSAADTGTPPDYTSIPTESLGIKPVPPRKDPKTGFVVGGKNPTPLLGKLAEVAGRSIADLERDMRPDALSGKGFLARTSVCWTCSGRTTASSW